MIETSNFGRTPLGEEVKLFTLTNKNGMQAKITNYGVILCSLKVPVDGTKRETVLGFDNLEEYTNKEYINNCPYFGAIIGRFGNRIGNGKVVINGKELNFPINNGPNTLHGGINGFDKKVWNAEIIDANSIQFTYLSVDGEENFPGNLSTKVIYRLTNCNDLQICYEASTDKTTPVNLTQHSYFNLSDNSENALNHLLQIEADHILETDENLIPSGTLLKVENTCYDFKELKAIKKDIAEIENYDDCYAFELETSIPRKVAVLISPDKKVSMNVLTTFPGLQVYTGKYINVGINKKFGPFSGVALEAQGYPDAPNQPKFEHGWLHPGEIYKHQTNYKFSF